MTMTATNHDDQLGEIYQTMLNELNELNCTFGVSISRFHCCGRHGHGLWPSRYRPMAAFYQRDSPQQFIVIIIKFFNVA